MSDKSRFSPENVRRFVTLGGAILVALASGSNYVYSGYAPQLAARLKISSTQVNLIGMAGNLGVYGSGPMWGKVIDKSGPRIPLACAFFLQLIGYSGIRAFYTGAISFPPTLPSISPSSPAPASPSAELLLSLTNGTMGLMGQQTGMMGMASASGAGINTVGIVMMMVFMCMTGFGACAGLNSGMNTVAKSFPDEMRATAAGMTLAGYGLSAFLFSTISRTFFPGDTNAFLLTLSIGTALPMLWGMFLLKVVRPEHDMPPAESGWGRISGEGYQALAADDDSEVEDEEEELDLEDGSRGDTPRKQGGSSAPRVIVAPATPNASMIDSSTAAINDTFDANRSSSEHRRPFPDRRESHELSVSPPRPILLTDAPQDKDAHLVIGRGSLNRSRSAGSHRTTKSLGVHDLDVYGKALFGKVDFWMSFGILALLSGTGLMYINNVGSVVLALANEGATPKYDPVTIALYQGSQVSVVSLWNCLGRVAMGMMTDYAKTKFRIRRIWFCSFISIIFFISQICAQYVHSLNHLWMVSALVGFAYGNLFALLPIVVLEWFGLAHFSQNWGVVSLSPGVGGNLANLLFGRVYDSHTVRASGFAGQAARIATRAFALVQRGGGAVIDPSDHSHDCIVGQECYETAFKFTTTGCLIALVLSLVAAIRRERQSRRRKKQARLEARWAQEGL